MSKKESDGKLYRVYKKQDSHINTKVNEDGRKAAIQFGENNNLNGPVDIEEVDIDEIILSRTSREMDPYVQIILDEVVAPTIRYWLELGSDKLLCYISDKGIPSAKHTIKKFVENNKVYFEGIKDGLVGKEIKAITILQKAEENKSITSVEVEKVKNQNFDKEFHSQEEIQQVIAILQKSVLVTATCIRILTNAIVFDDGTEPDKLEVLKKQLEELGTKEVMNQISLMLEEKNRNLLDEGSYQVLSAFSQGNLIVSGKTVPITKYIN